MTEEDVLEIRYILRQSFNRLGLQEESVSAPSLPYRPLLIEIAHKTQTGCNNYSKILKQRSDSKKNVSVPEKHWHTELNCTLGVDFWCKVYELTSKIKYENKLKWLQFQINRKSLYTKPRVNKFNQSVSPLCSHLFDMCKDVHTDY